MDTNFLDRINEIYSKKVPDTLNFHGDGDVELKNIDAKLKGQLTTPVYAFRNGKILIEPKAEIKKRLGNSPDRADAYVNGLYALQFVDGQLVGGKDAYADDYEDEPYGGNYSAMAM